MKWFIVNNFHLYSTSEGLTPISSPIKKQILSLLTERGRTQKEVMENIQRSQSTTARHLLELEALRMINSQVDVNDSRRKIYTLTGELVATGGKPAMQLKTHMRKVIGIGLESNGNLMENINKSLRYVIESWGLSLDEMLRETGHDIGNQISKELGNTNGEMLETLNVIAKFWAENDMGTLEIQKKRPLVIRIESNYDCSGVPDVGRPLCAMDEGIMEAILSKRTGKKWKVREFVCHGTGHDHCLFSVKNA